MSIISKIKMPGMADAYDIGVDWENVKDKPDVGSIDVGVTNEVLNINTNDDIAVSGNSSSSNGLPDASSLADGTGLVVVNNEFRTTEGFPFHGKLFDDIQWVTPVPETYLDTVTDGTSTFYKISEKVIKQEFLNKNYIVASYTMGGSASTRYLIQYDYGDGYTAIGTSKSIQRKQIYVIQYPVEVVTQKDGTTTAFTSAGIWVRNMAQTYYFTLQSLEADIPINEVFLPDSVPKYNNYFTVEKPADYPPADFAGYDQLVADGLAVRLADSPTVSYLRYYLVKYDDNYLGYDNLMGAIGLRSDNYTVTLDTGHILHNEDGYIVLGSGGYSALGIVSVGSAGIYPSYFLEGTNIDIPSKGIWVLNAVQVSNEKTAPYLTKIYKEVKKLDNLFLDTDYINGLIEAKIPAYSSADEGKVLKIVNGVPTWVSEE